MQARYDALTAGGPGAVEAVWLAQRDDLLARLDELRGRREVLDAVRTAAAETDRSVLLLDLDRTHPRAAVAVGDVDTAEHVAVLTPGFGTTVQDGLGAEGETAAALRDRSLSALGGAGRGGESVAAVAWLGYDVPAGVVAVSTPDAARSGGADLARFYDGIDASRRADPHLTALGHSYGSLTTGYALQQAHGVDDAVVFGSPGLGTDHVDGLHVPSGAHRRRRGPVGPGRGSRVVRRRPEPAGRRDGAVGPPRDPAGRHGDGGLGAARRLPDSGHDQPVQHRRDRRRPARERGSSTRVSEWATPCGARVGGSGSLASIPVAAIRTDGGPCRTARQAETARCSRGLTPRARLKAVLSANGLLVADPAGDGGQRRVRVAQQVRRQRQPPAGQELHRRLAHERR